MEKERPKYDALIIGAGAAGIGMGILFEKIGLKRYAVLERDAIGSSFRQWPSYIRFISPSFTGNFFNAVDLNAVSPDTSPAYTLKTEHPSGEQYAEYLELVASHFKVKTKTQTHVESIKKQGDAFEVKTDRGLLESRFVIWAGGEFQNPSDLVFDGAEHCVHSSIAKDLSGDSFTIIGGYESGMELAAHLLSKGASVLVIDKHEPWEENVSDSSISLAPSTRDKLKDFIGSSQLRFLGKKEVVCVERDDSEYTVKLGDGTKIVSPTKPILATGFRALPSVVEHLFERNEEGHLKLTGDDESSMTPGLFLVGPRVRHQGAIFCFIYKFRQRFPIVGEAIAARLGIKADGIEEYRAANMYLRDLSCCLNECSC